MSFWEGTQVIYTCMYVYTLIYLGEGTQELHFGDIPELQQSVVVVGFPTGTQFTSFTGTKVQILTAEELCARRRQLVRGTQFTSFTGTKVQILTDEELCARRRQLVRDGWCGVAR